MKHKIKKKYYLYFLLALFALPLIIFFYKEIKATLFVTAFIVGNIIVSAYKRDFQFPIEIEILTVGIVLCTLKYGLKAGILIAVFGTILSSAFYGYYSPFMIPMIIGNIIGAAIPFAMPLQNIFLLGLVVSIVKNAFVFVFYHFVFNYDITKNLAYGTSNLFVNMILFLNIAPFIYAFM
ncbi:MAG: hypothetical protein V1859_01470 [archaeon]